MSILELIKELPDPRMEGKVVHKISSIIFVALCGILSNCESWSDIEDYGKIKKKWLETYVDLSNGIPSEWTFRKIFTLLDPEHMERLLRSNAAAIVGTGKRSEQIAIDGKALRGSSRQEVKCLHSS